VFKFEPTFNLIVQAVEKQKATIAFSRKQSAADVQIPIDLSVEGTSADGKRVRSQKASKEFLSCNQQLLNNSLHNAKPNAR
jgi:hypothetical protein